MMSFAKVTSPRRPLSGSVVLPGSKSLTNRAMLLAALANGESRLTNVLASDDTRYMRKALGALGVVIVEAGQAELRVSGTGKLNTPISPLYVGNAGTAARFLTGAAALVDGEVVIDGDEQMRQRPIGELLAAMGQLGVQTSANSGCPPITVRGRAGLRGGRVVIDGSLSSQFISALLMICPYADAPVELALLSENIGARGYVDLTIDVMRAFGAQVEPQAEAAWRILPTGYSAQDFAVPGDASAATYIWACAALTNGQIEICNDASLGTQPDAQAREIIATFPDLPTEIDGSQMQDAIPTIAALAALAQSSVRFRNIQNLRVKECDRIAAMRTELCRLDPELAEEVGDDLIVHGKPNLRGTSMPTRFQTYHDHRIAMSLALLGLAINDIEIEDPGCVSKTFPAFWDVLSELGVVIEFYD